MKIQEIKDRIKNKNSVCFYTEGYHYAVLIEDILLRNKFIWAEHPDGKTLLKGINRNNNRIFDKMWIYINCFNISNIITFTIGSIERTIDVNHVVNVYSFSEQELNSMFINEPSYKPKRIERTL